MRCTIQSCPGSYESRKIVFTARRAGGDLVLIADVPAEVCAFCGDDLILSETSRRIEDLLARAAAGKCRPVRTAPVFEYGEPADATT